MTTQIAVKLPDRLVGELDRLVEAGAFDSRSQAVRSGLKAMVAARRREDVDREYRNASAQVPESDVELAEAHRLAVDAIHDEPWERWWYRGARSGGARRRRRRAGRSWSSVATQRTR